MRHVPEIKLIRTDTTLDLSQKAEKVCFRIVWPQVLNRPPAEFTLRARSAPLRSAASYKYAAQRVKIGTLVPHTGPKAKKKEKKNSFRIVKRGLNLMRSMQQGISTHYNTRFGI